MIGAYTTWTHDNVNSDNKGIIHSYVHSRK